MDIQSPISSLSVTKVRPMTFGKGTGVLFPIRIPESDATVRYALADLLPGSGDAVQTIISERVQFDTLGGKLTYLREQIATARRILRLRRTLANRTARAVYARIRKKSKRPWDYQEFKRLALSEYQKIANRAGVVDTLNELLAQRASILTKLRSRKYPERRMETFTTAMALPDQPIEVSCNDASPLSAMTLANNTFVVGQGKYRNTRDGLAILHAHLPCTAVGSANHEGGELDMRSAVLAAAQEAIRLHVSWGVRQEASDTQPGYRRSVTRPSYSASTPVLLDPDNDRDDEVKRALTFSRLSSLHGEEDREFVLARSVGELKDLPETLKQGMEFLKFIGSLRNGPIKALTRLKTIQDAAKAYLGYKFAVAPTVEDVRTVLSNTREYLLETRRQCVQLAQQATNPVVRVTRRYRASDYPKYDEEDGFFESDIPLTSLRASGSVRLAFPQYLPMLRVSVRTWNNTDHPAYTPFALDGANSVLRTQDLIATEQVSFSRPYKWVTNTTYAQVYKGWLDDLRSSLGVDITSWSGSIPEGSDRHMWDVAPAQDDHRLGISVSRLPPPSPYSEYNDWSCPLGNARIVGASVPSRYNAPIYVRNLVSGVMYADYATSALREFLSNRGSPLTRFISGTDLLLTMWELAPLSFVFDWFTTSHSLWETFQNLVDTQEAPEPENGFWCTSRCELYVALCNLRQSEWAVSTWIPGHHALASFVDNPTDELLPTLAEYYRIAGEYTSTGSELLTSWTFIQPRWLEVQTSALLQANRGKFFRSGLYKAKRGELIPSFNWLTSFLRVKLKLNASKLGTLGAMALSWAK